MNDEPTADQPEVTAEEEAAVSAQPEKTVFCGWCGAHASPPPATWSMITMGDRGPQLLCEACTRTNLRSIESQLSTDWW